MVPKRVWIGLLFLLLLISFAVWRTVEQEGFPEDTITLRFAIVSGPSHTHNRAIENWAEQVKRETGGRLEIKLLGGGQLGGERDYTEGMQLGSIEMAQVSTGPLSSFLPNFMALSLPYIVTDYDQLNKLVTGPVGDYLFAELQARGIKGLTWFTNGFRSVFTRETAVNSPEDLSGLKVRVMESPLMVSTLNAMGASATPMAYGELYTALQQGVMDGAENAPGNILTGRFYEVAEYFSLTKHFAPPGIVAMSMRSYKKLPADLQEYLVKAAQELGRMERALDQKEQEEAINTLEQKGMTVIREPALADFKRQVAPVIDQFSHRVDPQLMNILREELNL